MTTMQPIITFKNQEQLNNSLTYWKNKLCLNDWNITAVVKDRLSSEDALGLNTYEPIARSSYIQIKKTAIEDAIDRFCHEYTLVHELLHCSFALIYNLKKQNDLKGIVTHQLIDSLAKSLIMTKYNIRVEWFNNK